jgi:hypothetical protein
VRRRRQADVVATPPHYSVKAPRAAVLSAQLCVPMLLHMLILPALVAGAHGPTLIQAMHVSFMFNISAQCVMLWDCQAAKPRLRFLLINHSSIHPLGPTVL